MHRFLDGEVRARLMALLLNKLVLENVVLECSLQQLSTDIEDKAGY
jgi:hypothetical protein